MILVGLELPLQILKLGEDDTALRFGIYGYAKMGRAAGSLWISTKVVSQTFKPYRKSEIQHANSISYAIGYAG